MTAWAHRGRDGSLELSLLTRGVTSCLLDTVVRAVPRAVLRTEAGPVWLIEEYRPEAQAFPLYLAAGHGEARAPRGLGRPAPTTWHERRRYAATAYTWDAVAHIPLRAYEADGAMP
jgi:hypothetical protein